MKTGIFNSGPVKVIVGKEVTMKTIFSSGPIKVIIRREVKVLLKQAMKIMNSRVTEPNHSNVRNLNSHVFIDYRDEFFKYEYNGGHEYIFRAIWNFVIILYDFDLYYKDRIDWVIEKLRETDKLLPREVNRPRRSHWREQWPEGMTDEAMAKILRGDVDDNQIPADPFSGGDGGPGEGASNPEVSL